MLSESLQQHLAAALQTPVADAKPIAGGDINRAARITGADGRQWFVKFNSAPEAGAMLRAEALSLALLRAPRVIAVPRVHTHGVADDGTAFLVLDYVTPGPRHRLFWERFGRQLADVHGITSARFGFGHDNFIGSLPQSNTRHDTWPEFYAAERLRPQLRLALQAGLLDAGDEQRLEKLVKKLPSLCPDEPPAMIHGDLWSGNFLCDTEGQPVLIDPAACFAHREMDMAMARLFGGFDPAFFDSYDEYWGLEPGFDKRIDVYQLYYLLVHVNLFGGGYVPSVKGVLKRFA